jgi:hypothetical protein
MLALPWPAWAAWPAIEISAEQVEYGGHRLQDLRLTLAGEGDLNVEVGTLFPAFLERGLENLAVSGRLTLGDGAMVGVDGLLRAEGLPIHFSLARDDRGLQARLWVSGLPLSSLSGLDGVPAAIAWVRGGQTDAVLRYEAPRDQQASIEFSARAAELAFDSPDGRFAGEALHLEIEGRVVAGDPPGVDLTGAVISGELLLDNFYRDFGEAGLNFSLSPRRQADGTMDAAWRISDGGSLDAAGRAQWSGQPSPELRTLEIARLELAFPGAYRRYLQAMAAAWTLDGLEVTGTVSWSGQWRQGAFQSGDLEIDGLSVIDRQRSRFAVTGLQAHLRPGDHDFDSHVLWRGLLLGRINLGAGEVALDSAPGVIELLQPLELGVLGGKLRLHELRAVLPRLAGSRGVEPDVSLRADLADLDMERLTEALDWPPFNGRISGRIPGVRLQGGVLDVDGEILVQVFDGRVTLDDLRIERPFGVLPSLAANVVVKDVDLEQVTRTFSFGRISGRLDGEVRDLRMLDWRPVAFDGWLGTPDRQERKTAISRQAVNHLTTIGGGRATAALTGPLMRLFNDFSYRRLGLGCRLQNNVCEIRGIGEDQEGVVLLEGAGVPKITIRAYNRRVDWPQMVENLQAIAAEDPSGP